MELSEAIRGRRSIRRFEEKEVGTDLIEYLLSSATFAPTACNRQAWHFIVIDDRKIMHLLVDSGAANFILGAPIGILATYSNQTDNTEWSDHLVSGSMAIQNICLAAYEKGLGTCVVCHLPPKEEMRDLLGIPESYDPIAYLAIGYPDYSPPQINRKPLSECMTKNAFGQRKIVPLKGLWLKRIFRGIYYCLPMRKHIKPLVDALFEKRFDNGR